MSHEQLPLDLQALWQQQATVDPDIALADIKKQALRFQWTIHRRNFREYAAIVLLIIWGSVQALAAQQVLIRLGGVLMVLGVAYVGLQLWWRASAVRMDSHASAEAYLDVHRRELARQIAALRGVWHWYLLPMIPGMVVTMLPAILRNPTSGLRSLGISLGVFVFVYALNLRAASQLQRQLDELKQLE
jgi:hypothetical protein